MDERRESAKTTATMAVHRRSGTTEGALSRAQTGALTAGSLSTPTESAASKHVGTDSNVADSNKHVSNDSHVIVSESSGGAYTSHSGEVVEPTPQQKNLERQATRQSTRGKRTSPRRGSGSAGRSVISSTIEEEPEHVENEAGLDKDDVELSISSPRASSIEDLHDMRKWASPSSREHSHPPVGLYRPHVDVEALMKREQEKEDQIQDLKQKLKVATDQAAGAMLTGFERYAVAQKVCEKNYRSQ